MLLPSGPGAPRFDATAANANHNRPVTDSIVAANTSVSLRFDFGSACVRETLRWETLAPSASAFAYCSAVSNRNPSCLGCSLTGTASPPPGLSTPRVTAGFRRPCGFIRSSDFWRVIVFRSLVLRTTACAEPDRSHCVSFNALRSDLVANTRNDYRQILGITTVSWFTRRTRLTTLHFHSIPPRIYDFFRTTSRAWAFTSLPKVVVLRRSSCLVDVRLPLSGPGLDFTSCTLTCSPHTAAGSAHRRHLGQAARAIENATNTACRAIGAKRAGDAGSAVHLDCAIPPVKKPSALIDDFSHCFAGATGHVKTGSQMPI
jgi:hypothetical protein